VASYSNRARRSPRLVVATIVLVFLAGGLTGALLDHVLADRASSGSPSATRSTNDTSSTSGVPTTTAATTSTTMAPVLSVTSVTPANGAQAVAPNAPITVTLSAALSQGSPLPVLSPMTPGSWHANGASLTFTPSTDFVPMSEVKLTLPGGPAGILGEAGGHLAQSVSEHFQVANGSVVRLQQLLSLLDYSPLKWVSSGAPISPTDSGAETAALYKPPAGTFAWRQRGWPVRLLAMWEPGIDNVFTRGLIMSFQADHEITPNGVISASLWASMLAALFSNTVNTGGYNYALANKTTPESLTIYHDGAVVVTTPANTGIGASPTPDGTFPVFERLRQQVMRGTNPNGDRYADLVQYIAYFHANDAVHYMDRADYGIPQSLGCIELPLASAARVWPYLAYGTLVTIIN